MQILHIVLRHINHPDIIMTYHIVITVYEIEGLYQGHKFATGFTLEMYTHFRLGVQLNACMKNQPLCGDIGRMTLVCEYASISV